MRFKEYLLENNKIVDPGDAFQYVLKMNKPCPECEDALATSKTYAYWYASEILHGRFKKGEYSIAEDAQFSYDYAKNVLRSRFEDGEEVIATSPSYAYLYARDIIKGPFPAGEKIIFDPNRGTMRTYIYDVILKNKNNVTNADIKRILSNQNFIEQVTWYDDFVNEYFKDNSILRDMWIKYGKIHQ